MVLVSSMWGVATLAGPAIGGIFAQTGHWRLAFWAVVPIAAVLALLVQTQLMQRAGAGNKRVEAPLGRIALLAVSVLIVSVSSLSHRPAWNRSEEHTSELQSLMRISYAVFCLKKQQQYY